MADATSNLSILVKVRDEASGALSRLSGDVSELGGSLDFAGGKAGILAGALAAMAGMELIASVKAFAEAEAQMARFDAILKTLPEGLQKYREQILQTADASMRLGFDNETASVQMAKLLQATHDGELTFKAFQAAMDLARYKGISLEEATQALILAFQGGGRMLKQLGIDVDEHASKQTILEAVMRATKGQADAYSATLFGLNDTLRVYLGEVQEALGQPFAEFVKGTALQVKEWINQQGGINAAIEKFNGVIQVAQIALISFVITGLVVAISAALAAIGAFGMLSAGILALIGVGAALYTSWQTNFLGIRDIVLSVVSSITSSFNSFINTTREIMNVISSASAAMAKINPVSSAIGGIKSLLGLAEGGIVTRPTLAMVGEGGEAEAVIPLSRLGGMGGGGVVINLQGDFYTDTESAERWANQIARIIKYQLKLA